MTKYTVTDGTHTETYPNKDAFINAMNAYGDENALYYMGTDITVVAGKRFERIKHGGYNIGWYHSGGVDLIPAEWFDN